MAAEVTFSQDDWPGRYGSRGVWVAGIPVTGYPPAMPRLFPSVMSLTGGTYLIQQATSTDPRSLPKPDLTGRTLAMYYSSLATGFDVRLTAADPGRVTFHLFDHYQSGQEQSVQLLTLGGTPIWPAPVRVGDYRFHGIYATFDYPGPCIVRWVKTAGFLASISGVFLSPPVGPPPDTVSPVVVSGAVDAAGTRLIVSTSEPVTGSNGFTFLGQYGGGTIGEEPTEPVPLEHESGLTFRVARDRPIFRGEQLLLSYAPGDVVDTAGNALTTFAGMPVENLSDAHGPVWQGIGRTTIVQSLAGNIRTSQVIEMLMWPEE